MGGYGDVAGVRYCFSGSSGVCPGNTPVCGTGEDRVFGSGDWGRGNKGMNWGRLAYMRWEWEKEPAPVRLCLQPKQTE